MIKRIIISLIIITSLFSEQNEEGNFQHTESSKFIRISKIFSPPIIDGFLEDSCWVDIPIISDFIQDEPFNMAVPTAKNEIKIAYDEQSIYVAARLLDVFPEEITKHMARRDGWRKVMMSDWFSIEIDSYHDHQTAFEFLVNSMGVQFDDMVFDDSYRNTEWNAVWESEVSFDEKGWNVEMRIPFSVLRFSDETEITMGLNLNRYIQRKNELMSWVVSPQGQGGIVSKFGDLEGISGIETSKKPFSIHPFINLGNINTHNYHLSSSSKDEFGISHSHVNKNDKKVGLNLKYLLSQDIVIDAAFNPDYGQIEADPADFNISYFETYFMEKRPFFMENSTLFDTPIEVFYSRRIGTNREYMMGNWQAPMNSMVKYAGKITGKTKNGLSFGTISAVTNDDNSSWFEVNSNSNFLVSRVTQDLFEGNSYMGFLSTIYNDSTMTHYVNSVDMLSYFLDNQLVIDGQLIHSQTEESGSGISFEMNYNPTEKILSSWIDFEYFDKEFNINDVGYLYRNNLKKIQGGVGFYWPELDLSIPILDGRVDLNFNKMTNLDDLVLNNSMGISTTVTFNNLWYLGGGYNYMAEHHDDLSLYDYHEKIFGPSIMIPKGSEINTYIGNDPHAIYTVNSNATFWNNDYEDGEAQSISFGIHASEFLDFDFEYRQSASEEKYRWIEAYYKATTEYIFAASHNQSQKYIYGINYSHSRKTSLQLHAEYYTSKNDYGLFYKYDSENMDYDAIELSDYYVSYEDLTPENSLDNPLNPQDHVYHYTKDHILNLNLVFNHEFRPGSNVYFVYSVYRDVVGKEMDSFSQFLKYVPTETELVEVNFTQSLYLKIDYGFDY
ncbi:MAG: carbohydrate binding family 9 domain-containing protein [Candidatus Marinimicrobia bacterium]|nr:carbohydrate binding family 9 domain-containing protein [Candidatus Neomarinimicrobiota bacterium]